jgi:predicted transcriptional regulator
MSESELAVAEFAGKSAVSKRILYKITSGKRDNIQLENCRQGIQTRRLVEQGRDQHERNVAIITNRASLERLKTAYQVDGTEIQLQEYPCSTVEEAIKQSILAERDGVDAIICGPITAYTVEDVVHTPVIGLNVDKEQVTEALRTAAEKTTS